MVSKDGLASFACESRTARVLTAAALVNILRATYMGFAEVCEHHRLPTHHRHHYQCLHVLKHMAVESGHYPFHRHQGDRNFYEVNDCYSLTQVN